MIRAALKSYKKIVYFVVTILYLCVSMGLGGGHASAAPLPGDEIKLLKEDTNWVGCSSSGTASDSSGTASGTPTGGVGFDDTQSADTGGHTNYDTDGTGATSTGRGSTGTSLSNNGKGIDGDAISYIALNPGWAQTNNVAIGDIAALTYKGKTIYAIYGDNHEGPDPHAEISVKADLGLKGSPPPDNLSGVHFTLYPGSRSQLGITGSTVSTNGGFTQAQIDAAGAQVSGGGAPSSGTGDSTGAGSSCCPSSSADTTTATGGTGLVWPFATKATSQYNRVDQGWDIQDKAGAGVYAIAPGTLNVFMADPGGFGNNYPVEKLDSSIGGPSDWVYYGHVHIDPGLNGKHVNAGDLIAHANVHDGDNGSGAPPGWLEIGFSQPGTDSPVDRGSGPTAAGAKMKQLLLNAQPNPAGGPSSSAPPAAGSSSSGATACCPTAADSSGSIANVPPGPGNVAQNEKAIWGWMVGTGKNQPGLSPAGAAGVMGNMFQENGFSTADNSGGMGIVQWTSGRRTAEIALAQKDGLQPTDLQAQLNYLYAEMTGGPGSAESDKPAYDAVKSATNPVKAADDWERLFERAGTPDMARREAAARHFLTRYGGTAAASAGTTATNTGTADSTSACCPPSGSSTVDAGSPSTWTKMYTGANKAKVDSLARGAEPNPKILAIHYTEGDIGGQSLLDYFASAPGGDGIQFNIDKSGQVFEYYPLNDMQETWEVKAANSKSIGIEITGRDVTDLLGNQKQFDSVVATAKFLCDHYNIPCGQPKGDITGDGVDTAQGMLGHDEIPSNDHNDPDAKYGQSITRTDSSQHPYMMKLRTAMGFDPTPGQKGGSSGTGTSTTTATDGTTTGDQCPAVAKDTSGYFTVSGNRINYTSQPGKEYIPYGTSVVDDLDQPNWRNSEYQAASDAQIQASALYWHVNTIRLQASEANIMDNPTGGKSYNEAAMQRLGAEVDEIESAGKIPMINDNVEQTDKPQQGPIARTDAFWKAVASYFANQVNVDKYANIIFDIYNEPATTGSAWQKGMQDAVDSIRNGTDLNNNLIVVEGEGPNRNPTLANLDKNPIKGADIAYAYHHVNMNDPSSWDSVMGLSLATKVPIIDGEWAQYVAYPARPECFNQAPKNIPAYFDKLRNNHIGLIFWSLEPGVGVQSNNLGDTTDKINTDPNSKYTVFPTTAAGYSQPNQFQGSYKCNSQADQGKGAGTEVMNYFNKYGQ